MDHRAYSDEGAVQHVAIADVADHQFGVIGKIGRPLSLAVHLRDQVIEDAYGEAASEQQIRNMRPDEARSAGDENMRRHLCSFVSAGMRTPAQVFVPVHWCHGAAGARQNASPGPLHGRAR